MQGADIPQAQQVDVPLEPLTPAVLPLVVFPLPQLAFASGLGCLRAFSVEGMSQG